MFKLRSSWYSGNGRSIREAESGFGDPFSLESDFNIECSLGIDLAGCLLVFWLPGVGDTVLKLMPFDLMEPERVTLLWVISSGLEGGVSILIWGSIEDKVGDFGNK